MKPHEIIHKLRKEEGHKQSYMAAQLHMTQPNYSNIENGKTKPTPEVEKRIAKLLNVPVSRFYAVDESPENSMALKDEKIKYLELLLYVKDKLHAADKAKMMYKFKLKALMAGTPEKRKKRELQFKI